MRWSCCSLIHSLSCSALYLRELPLQAVFPRFQCNWLSLSSASGRQWWELWGWKEVRRQHISYSSLSPYPQPPHPVILTVAASSLWSHSPGIYQGPIGNGGFGNTTFPLCFSFTNPCFASQLSHQLGNQSPVLNSFCFKYLEWFLFTWWSLTDTKKEANLLSNDI